MTTWESAVIERTGEPLTVAHLTRLGEIARVDREQLYAARPDLRTLHVLTVLAQDVYKRQLRGNLNDGISDEDAIEMLAQHLITRPVFDALFGGYDFAASNPVAQTMERMLAVLDEHSLDAENSDLQRFYDSVRMRVKGIDSAEGRQKIIVELYDKFFATAFKKTVDKLGIVYTPVEIVDFILRSADEVLREHFGQGLTCLLYTSRCV